MVLFELVAVSLHPGRRERTGALARVGREDLALLSINASGHNVWLRSKGGQRFVGGFGVVEVKGCLAAVADEFRKHGNISRHFGAKSDDLMADEGCARQ